MEIDSLKAQYFKQQLEAGIRKVLARQVEIAVAKESQVSGFGRGAKLAESLRNIHWGVEAMGERAVATVEYPLMLRFADMKRIGNWGVYNKPLWRSMYRDTLQDIRYEFREWVRKNFPQMLNQLKK